MMVTAAKGYDLDYAGCAVPGLERYVHDVH